MPSMELTIEEVKVIERRRAEVGGRKKALSLYARIIKDINAFNTLVASNAHIHIDMQGESVSTNPQGKYASTPRYSFGLAPNAGPK